MIRPPPTSRAWLSAPLASRTSSSWVAPCSGKAATPPETVIALSPTDHDPNVSDRRLTSVAADSAVMPGSTSANSSSSRRQTQS